jgi:hypothetical protein
VSVLERVPGIERTTGKRKTEVQLCGNESGTKGVYSLASEIYSSRTKRHWVSVIVALLVIIFASTPLQADRILVIGDSWAEPVAPELQSTLHENGHTDITVEATPFIGEARQMKTVDVLKDIFWWLEERPDVTVVQMSIGGNDWLNSGWTPAWAGTAAEVDLIAGIIQNVEIVVDSIISHKPDIQVLWSSYDFPRPINIGTPLQVNTFLITMAEQMAQFAATKPGLSVVDISGVLQVVYGFDGVQHNSFDPGFAIPPGDSSLPEPAFPSPFEPFLRSDPWHLNSDGYKTLTQAQYNGFYASMLAGESFKINAGLNDAWYYPLTTGQGFFITVFPDLGMVSLAWFTYDTERPPAEISANLGEPGHRWLTALGPIDGNSAVLNITLTSGGLFDAPTDIENTDDGTIILTFDDCNSGTVEYDIPSIDRQGTVPIERVANDNIALCEALSEP